MKSDQFKEYYRQILPHIQPVGGTFFVTFRLANSIPANEIIRLKEDFDCAISKIKNDNPINKKLLIQTERTKYFSDFESLLDSIKSGPHFLKQPEVAKIVMESIHKLDGELYTLLAYCIMSNHVHLLIDTGIQIPEDIDFYEEILNFTPLHSIMKRIKGPSALYANRILTRKGTFWQRESFDRLIRSEKELFNVISYILNNPVKAKVVKDWRDFPFSYLKGMDHFTGE